MARAIWTGSISFGLVTVPVGLYSATEDHTIHFNQFERGTSDRVRNRRVNERTGKDVDYSDIVKGREVGDGDFVLVEPKELDDIAPGRSRSIEITGFVDIDEIDPIFFQRTYYLAPDGDEYSRAYMLLGKAMEKANRAGVAKFVMRGKEYLTIIRPHDGLLALDTLYFADEIRDPKKELDSLPRRAKVKPEELSTAVKLIESMVMKWRPGDFRDTYRQRVEKMIRAKRRGKEVVSEGEPPEATNVVDLMEALRQSVSGSNKKKSTKEPTKKQLYDEAAKMGVANRSRMSRDELAKAVRRKSRKRAS